MYVSLTEGEQSDPTAGAARRLWAYGQTPLLIVVSSSLSPVLSHADILYTPLDLEGAKTIKQRCHSIALPLPCVVAPAAHAWSVFWGCSDRAYSRAFADTSGQEEIERAGL